MTWAAHEALEMTIEREWCELTAAYRKTRTYALTHRGALLFGFKAVSANRTVEVGTYTSSIPLADFRADVFCAFEELRRKYG